MCGLWQEMRVPESGEIPVRVGWGVRRMYSQADRTSTQNYFIYFSSYFTFYADSTKKILINCFIAWMHRFQGQATLYI